ncbi:MAG: hypothetical protein H9W81_01050 [Enterococcus sp.]|nr:hypothetical protein [Enterococcus sp.]
MEAFDTDLLAIEKALREGITDLGYNSIGTLAGTETFKENEITRQTMSYSFQQDHVVCTHETRLLMTGSRTVKVKRLRDISKVWSVLQELDNTIVKY